MAVFPTEGTFTATVDEEFEEGSIPGTPRLFSHKERYL
jgi:hypothetical protein